MPRTLFSIIQELHTSSWFTSIQLVGWERWGVLRIKDASSIATRKDSSSCLAHFSPSSRNCTQAVGSHPSIHHPFIPLCPIDSASWMENIWPKMWLNLCSSQLLRTQKYGWKCLYQQKYTIASHVRNRRKGKNRRSFWTYISIVLLFSHRPRRRVRSGLSETLRSQVAPPARREPRSNGRLPSTTPVGSPRA